MLAPLYFLRMKTFALQYIVLLVLTWVYKSCARPGVGSDGCRPKLYFKKYNSHTFKITFFNSVQFSVWDPIQYNIHNFQFRHEPDLNPKLHDDHHYHDRKEMRWERKQCSLSHFAFYFTILHCSQKNPSMKMRMEMTHKAKWRHLLLLSWLWRMTIEKLYSCDLSWIE